MMPEMTGTELAAEVKRRCPGMRILFVTGYVGEAGDAGDLAGHELLRKPFTVDALAAAVAAALGGADGVSGSRPAAQTRQQSKRAQDRPAPLPRLDLDLRPGVAVDLPGEIIDAAGIGGRRLGEPDQAQRLAPPPEPPPALAPRRPPARASGSAAAPKRR